jgi:hypothetical protein
VICDARLPRALTAFGGNIERRFEPDGLICEISLNIYKAQEGLGRPPKKLPAVEKEVGG